MSFFRTVSIFLGGLATFAGIIYTLFYVWQPEYAYVPDDEKVADASPHNPLPVFDLRGAAAVSTDRKNGAVPEELLRQGRKAFYQETFGNEVFLTDVMGVVNGPLTAWQYAKALILLRGRGTANLKVEVAKTTVVGGRIFAQGAKVSTGLDVAKGAFVPVGVKIKLAEGGIKVGVTCAACHSTVDPVSRRVVYGAANSDLNLGVLIALASNSAAYFTHTRGSAFYDAPRQGLVVATSNGGARRLPQPAAIERMVDVQFLQWRPGIFDASVDLQSNPMPIPEYFTDYRYSRIGAYAAGPFKALSAFNKNVHAHIFNPLAQAGASRALFNMDKEIYLGTLLQNAANPRYRYEPYKAATPSKFFTGIDAGRNGREANDAGTPGFSHASLITPVSAQGPRVVE